MEKLVMLVFGLLVEKMEYSTEGEFSGVVKKLSELEFSGSFEVLEGLIKLFEEVFHIGYSPFSIGAYEIYSFTGYECSEYLEKYVELLVSLYSSEYKYL